MMLNHYCCPESYDEYEFEDYLLNEFDEISKDLLHLSSYEIDKELLNDE